MTKIFNWIFFLKKYHAILLSALIGLIIAIWFFPISYFTGTHDYWQFPYTDIMQAKIGMQYFLNEPWHFPILDARNILYPDGFNIAFTDSLPLIALITKALYPLWPSSANYLCIWMLTCYILQGASASYLLSGFGRFPLPLHLFAALMALFAPILLIRVPQTTLCSQFYVLFSLGMAVRIINGQARPHLGYIFTALTISGFLTNVYFVAMILGVFLACQAQVFFEDKTKRLLIIRQVLFAACALGLVYYCCGFGGNVQQVSYGQFSMNLISPFYPQVSSLFGLAPIVDATGYQYEGFNYVGAGYLSLFFITLLFAWKSLLQHLRKYWSLGLLCVALTLFSLGPKIYAGTHLIVNICDYKLICIQDTIPKTIRIGIFNHFRSSGRFFWTVTYYTLIISLAVLWPQLRKRKLEWVFVILLLLQLSDLDALRKTQSLTHREVLKKISSSVKPLILEHSRLTTLPSFSCSFNSTGNPEGQALWTNLDLVYMASFRGIPVNSIYGARSTKITNCGKEVTDVMNRELEPGELLAFTKEKFSHFRVKQIYPNLKNCVEDDLYVFCSKKIPSLTELTKMFKPLPLELPPDPKISGFNMALKMPASQSSTYGNGHANLSVDGNIDGKYDDGSVSHTQLEKNPWWEVDLRTSKSINALILWNRTDTAMERLQNYWVFISDKPFSPNEGPDDINRRPGVFSYFLNVVPEPQTVIKTDKARGRFVRVQLAGTDFLSLAEVQVMGLAKTDLIKEHATTSSVRRTEYPK